MLRREVGMMGCTVPRRGRAPLHGALSAWLAAWLILGPAIPAFAQVFGTSAPDLGASGLDRRLLDGARMPPGLLSPDGAGQGGISFPVLSIASPVNGSVIPTPPPQVIITLAPRRPAPPGGA